MTQAIVGVFDSFQQAESAVARLVEGGLDRADMEVHASDETSGAERPVVADRPASAATEEVGIVGKIENFFGNMFAGDDRSEDIGNYQEAVRRGGALLTVNVKEESQVPLVRSTMHEAGVVDIDERVAHWKSGGYAGFDASAKPLTSDEVLADRQSFAVTRESLEVGKREVETGGVRVYSRATATPVSETVNLRDEHATIERRPVDRPATAADLKEGFVEIRETAEHAVVAKTAHVVEEVVVGRQATERTETINETLRGTDVEVEHVEAKSVDPVRAIDGVSPVAPVKPTSH
ncbi:MULTISPECIES: YsnF/AvaK domain-containing protein [unclassified Caballeronia]|jgi:uncharacterized protein (TIGR02271 family)|uniref:YsnF/AvaK domain-containing protein n=1 Tax=unclassified Caballeronia TaxID=2646786 RepID=UPI002028A66D|nr:MULTISPECIES: YsnF/AvaK domain-containing protein [unclassified Caballeronia]MDR5774517.1 YsnF/AvaK domain-containing protein [Caballeronia sp. LZ002]MDR5849953.1 YsnF/AvaK domain-containing protein [Caballeronia sp. LZ003]